MPILWNYPQKMKKIAQIKCLFAKNSFFSFFVMKSKKWGDEIKEPKFRFIHCLRSSFSKDFIVLQQKRNENIEIYRWNPDIRTQNMKQINQKSQKKNYRLREKLKKTLLTLPYLPVGSTSTNSEESISRFTTPFILQNCKVQSFCSFFPVLFVSKMHLIPPPRWFWSPSFKAFALWQPTKNQLFIFIFPFPLDREADQ